MKFGNRLKQERQKKQMTQQKVADDLNVSRQTISSWETENSYPDIESLIQLSNYYQVSLDTLLKEDTGMTEYLKKQEVLKSIKPVTIVLTIIDVMFIALICTDLLGIIKFNSWVIRLVFVMGILNAIALILLSVFMKKVSAKPTNYQKRIPIYVTIVAISIVISIILGYLGQLGVSGIFGGIAFGCIIVLLINRKKK
ncbi:helix-turn-helix transcriptional regulator [Companilactobacillus musae]|uniref:helix-turn-helix domain-containing protein n=1 Tax=Companilactobacillus musae TaxID=1903258 RepID=UPI000E65388B|nr:helix-turn-helix transcriptional regulator [Companilactobacillus musae]